jgi:hypothetical protein
MWDEALQLILDYQSTDDGRVGHLIQDPQRNPSKGIPIHIPYFLPHPKSILGVDHFLTSLICAHELNYKRPIPNLVEHNIS